MKLTNFFNTKYKGYAAYVLAERAIPGWDGLKPSARKALYSALKTFKGDKKEKVTNLVGAAYSHAAYAHGNVSLEDVIVGLGSHWASNTAPFSIVGSGGTLRAQGSAAARYLSVKLHPNSKIFTKDLEILEYRREGDQRIEPVTYLPVIPTLLTTRNSGIAIGFAYSSLMSFSVESVARATQAAYQKHEDPKSFLEPFVHQYDGTFEQIDGRWYSKGVYTLSPKGILEITGLPLDETYSSFENAMLKLLEAGKILNFENLSEGDALKYRITMNPASAEKYLSRIPAFEKGFHLGHFINRPNITVIDEKGKVLEFKSDYNKFLRAFVDWRFHTTRPY